MLSMPGGDVVISGTSPTVPPLRQTDPICLRSGGKPGSAKIDVEIGDVGATTQGSGEKASNLQ
jgi:hypothetical protein